MFKASWRRIVSWTGIALVLLNVLVPLASHAQRAHDPSRHVAHREMVLAVAGDWCVTAGSVDAADLRVIERAVSLEATLAQLAACDFCDQAPIGSAMPLPVVAGVATAPPTLQALRFVAYSATLAPRPAFELPASRAPPQV